MITFHFLRQYLIFFGINTLPTDKLSFIKYQLTVLPVILFAFFIFNPFTQTLRFLYEHFSDLNWSVYWEEYFYSTELYLTYLPIVFIQVYAVVNINILRHFSKDTELNITQTQSSFMEIRSDQGVQLLAINDLLFFEKKGRKTIMTTMDGNYTTNLTIVELEKTLSRDLFVRVNRSAIVSLKHVDHYSFWENEKYILKLKTGKEFIMTRQRLKGLRERLSNPES
ncbi:MAG: LytTR family DNA-binding domain-containing protein [Bacteroidota bacterium]